MKLVATCAMLPVAGRPDAVNATFVRLNRAMARLMNVVSPGAKAGPDTRFVAGNAPSWMTFAVTVGLRLQAQEAILFHANIGPYLADAERTPKASDDLRKIAAQIGGITATRSPLLPLCFASAGTSVPSRPRD